MNINDFQTQSEKAKKDMEKKLNAFKLEKVLSLWYFVRAASKVTIVGSKN